MIDGRTEKQKKVKYAKLTVSNLQTSNINSCNQENVMFHIYDYAQNCAYS